MTIDDLKAYRDALEIDIEDSRLEENPFIALEEDSDEIKYLIERRTALGGYLPSRNPRKLTSIFPEKTHIQHSTRVPQKVKRFLQPWLSFAC